MEVLYLDQLFVVNFLVDYCILLAAARISDVPLRRKRYLLAALTGAIYAALSVLPGLTWLALAPAKAASGMLLALIAFGGERRFWRCAVVFFAAAALFGGAVYALSLAAGSSAPGAALQRVRLRVLIPTFAVCYALVTTIFRHRMQSAQRMILPVTLTVNGRTLALRAIRDSGNVLRDPVTGLRVAVISAAVLRDVLGAFPDEPIAAVQALRGQVAGPRLLPYSAVGVSGGLLAAFRPDRLSVAGKDEELLLALSPTPVSVDKEYELLLPFEA